MSVVTNVILTTSIDDTGITMLNVKLTSMKYGVFRQVDQWAGGTKHVEASVYLAAFNYLDVDKFKACVAETEWDDPENVCVFMKTQRDERFAPLEWK